MNLVTMRIRLRRRIGNPSEVDVTNAILNEHINTAYREITNKFRFNLGRKICTFLTTDGVTRYGMPVDLAAVLNARNNTSEVRLEKYDVPRRYAVTGYTGDEITKGAPIKYVRFRDWMELIPVPDGIYEIEVFYKVAIIDLADDGDVPVIPESWHEGIIKLARAYYYDEQGDIPKKVAAHNDYKVWVSDQPVEVDEEKIDYDSGVSLPTLSDSVDPRLDFDHSP